MILYIETSRDAYNRRETVGNCSSESIITVQSETVTAIGVCELFGTLVSGVL